MLFLVCGRTRPLCIEGVKCRERLEVPISSKKAIGRSDYRDIGFYVATRIPVNCRDNVVTEVSVSRQGSLVCYRDKATTEGHFLSRQSSSMS